MVGLSGFADVIFNISVVKKNYVLSPSAGTNKKATDCTTLERARQLWGYVFGEQNAHISIQFEK